MRIEVEGFTREQIETALFSSARKVRYEYTVSNAADEHLGMLEIENGSVSFDSKAEVMRTFKGTVKESELMNLSCIDYRVTPWMCLEISEGREAKWPLGVFLVTPSKSMSNNINTIVLTGYDLSKIPYDHKSTSRVYVPAGAVYTSYVQQLLGEDVSRLEVEGSTLTKSYDQEWEIGESRLSIINTLLAGINYNPVHFDEFGVGRVDRYVMPNDQEITGQYIADNTSVIIDGISVSSDKFSIPNKWIRYTENADADYYISSYSNDDPDSPYSTVSRGRVIVDSDSVDDIASQAELDTYVLKIAAEAMQATDRLEFSTMNMPGHGYRECLWVEVATYGIAGSYIETAWEMELVPGGTMKHKCERTVVV